MSSGKILRNAHGSPGGGWASNCATYVEAERTWAPGALAPVVAFAAAVPSATTATARASAASERLILMGPPFVSRRPAPFSRTRDGWTGGMVERNPDRCQGQ